MDGRKFFLWLGFIFMLIGVGFAVDAFAISPAYLAPNWGGAYVNGSGNYIPITINDGVALNGHRSSVIGCGGNTASKVASCTWMSSDSWGFNSQGVTIESSGGCSSFSIQNYTSPGCGGYSYCTHGYWACSVSGTVTTSTNDADLDGIKDNVDQYPGDPLRSGIDVDGDGIDDAVDPWPNDPTLPGTGAVWKKTAMFQRKSDSAVVTVWGDGNNHYFRTWTGSGAVPQVTDDGTWRGLIDVPGASAPVTFASIVGGLPSGSSDVAGAGSAEQVSSDTAGLQSFLGAMDNDLGTKLGTIASTISSGDSNTASAISGLGSKLDDIKNAIQNQQPPTVDMSGTNSRLDTANTALGNIDSKLGSLPQDMLTKLGGEGDMPDPSSEQVAAVQDNSEVGDDANASKLDAEKSTLSSYFDSWWSANPVKSMVENTTVTASGSSSFTIDGGSLGTHSIDLSSLGDGLSAVGVILVGVAGLGGVLVVLRN